MIYIVSDLHIDNGRNGFNENRPAFNSFLDMVGDNLLVFNGDTLELWHNTWWEIINGPNKDLILRIRAKEEKWIIPGNHDIEDTLLSRFFHTSNIEAVRYAGRWKIFHGYQVDPILDEPQERWFAAHLDRFVAVANIPWLNTIRDKISDGDRGNDALISALENRGNFIVGHSHIAEDRGWFVNSGTWTGKRNAYIEIDDNDNASLKEFKEV